VKQQRLWFVYAMFIVVAWGVWGAWSDYPMNQTPPFPDMMVYVVWALTMIPPGLFALRVVGWKPEHDVRSILLGCAAGFLGAGGQVILFCTLRFAPAYLVFPFIALSPVVTIAMALVISKERATAKGRLGIALAVVAGVLLAVQQPPKAKIEEESAPKQADAAAARAMPAPARADSTKPGVAGVELGFQQTLKRHAWVLMSLSILLAWGIQGFVISHANKTMKAESIFFYMALTAVLLIPLALAMTDFKEDINWGFKGPPLTAMIQILNSIGALLLVYAFRYGKAIIVSPLTNAGAPVVTVAISLSLALAARTFQWTPVTVVNMAGIVIAIVATVLMAIEGEKGSESTPVAVEGTAQATSLLG
jgi:drug/metabolite transporter (DMT)-like permease